MHIDRHSLAISVGFTCFMLVVTVVPDLAAEKWYRDATFGPRTVPVTPDDVEKIGAALRTPAVAQAGSSVIHASLVGAEVSALAKYENEALHQAREAFVSGDVQHAEKIARALLREIGDEDDEAKRRQELHDKARLILANIQLETGRSAAAMKTLTHVSDDIPIADFHLWMRAEALEGTGEHSKAAALFRKIEKMDTRLKHRAIVRRAHALFAAKEWKQAERALRQVIDDYPHYPRRHRALFQRAEALMKLDREQAAANAYLDTFFEFPEKAEGAEARLRLAELEEEAVVPSKMHTRHQRYRRYRRLRINKHWDVARTLFLELQEDYATEDGHSKFEHDVEFQLALTAYHSRDFETAKAHLETLADAWDAGHRAGISRYLTFKYLSRTLAKMGDMKAALAALDRMGEGFSGRARMRNRAEFFEDHGAYEKARKIYEKLYSSYKERRWHYTWLLYKTGRFDEAYENLNRLAERSGGRRRAKYLYWTARTLERAQKHDEAAEIYREVRDNYDMGYYGLQARNRLLDMKHRTSVAGQVVASAEGIANSAETVLDALEEAEEALARSAGSAVRPDPRAIPRGPAKPENLRALALDESARQCEAETRSDQSFCDLKAGKLSPEAAHVLRAAFSPASKSGAPFLGTGVDPSMSEHAASMVTDSGDDSAEELDQLNSGEARVPERDVKLEKQENPPRVPYSTSARIHWEGRLGSTAEFAKARDGGVQGPVPEEIRAYDETSYTGGLARAAEEAGDLFPELVRAEWLWSIGLEKPARWSLRDVAIEFRELKKRWRPSSKPHELPNERWEYYIDNRRRGRLGFWGLDSDEKRFPVPENSRAKKALLERQQKIHEKRRKLEPVLLGALKEGGDYFMVRKYTLAKGGWYRKDPAGPAREFWMQAYPRAFPRMVVHHARKNGINPYLVWALMTVESSFNPDSLSTANALGLLQVIPRTGLKTAELIGDEDFGPQDLLNEDVAIQHGAFYFGKLVKKFRGQELFAIAGYNGGPHRVGDWLDMRGDDMPMDEFVEEIPFTQARRYTKKVLRFLTLYLKIYEGRDHLYVGQNVRANYRPHPKF